MLRPLSFALFVLSLLLVGCMTTADLSPENQKKAADAKASQEALLKEIASIEAQIAQTLDDFKAGKITAEQKDKKLAELATGLLVKRQLLGDAKKAYDEAIKSGVPWYLAIDWQSGARIGIEILITILAGRGLLASRALSACVAGVGAIGNKDVKTSIENKSYEGGLLGSIVGWFLDRRVQSVDPSPAVPVSPCPPVPASSQPKA